MNKARTPGRTPWHSERTPKANSFRGLTPKANSFGARTPKANSFRGLTPKVNSFRGRIPKANPLVGRTPKPNSLVGRIPKPNLTGGRIPKPNFTGGGKAKPNPVNSSQFWANVAKAVKDSQKGGCQSDKGGNSSRPFPKRPWDYPMSGPTYPVPPYTSPIVVTAPGPVPGVPQATQPPQNGLPTKAAPVIPLPPPKNDPPEKPVANAPPPPPCTGGPNPSDGDVGRKTQGLVTRPKGVPRSLPTDIEDELEKEADAIKAALLDFVENKMGFDEQGKPIGGLSEQQKKDLKDALDKAEQGDFGPLTSFIDDLKKNGPKYSDDLIAGLDAFKVWQELLQDVKDGDPIDAGKIQEAKDAASKFPDSKVQDSLKDGIAKIETQNDAWEDAINSAPDPNGAPGVPGGGGPYIVVVDGSGGIVGGGYFDGSGAYVDGSGGYADGSGAYADGSGGYADGSGAYVDDSGAYVASPPVAEATDSSTSGVVILQNPQGNGASVSYVLSDEHQYDMQAGELQTLDLASGDAWIVSFDRGGGNGTARYSLGEGTYEFTITENGWDLVQKQFQVTIDNTNLESDFAYLADGEEATVKAGQTATHASAFAIEMVFDQGDGGEPARKLLETGVYKVGVDPNKNRLDLFAAN